MTLPQVLFISQNSRTRRVYHDLLNGEECDLVWAKSVADSLAQLVINSIDIIVMDDSIPMFEVSMFIEMLEKKPEWSELPLVVRGFSEQRHVFPPNARFAETDSQIVSCLKDLCASI